MKNMQTSKYIPFPRIHLPDRQWPNREITQAPIWGSVDLRDGNQALPVPMNVSAKLELFSGIVGCGFKEIEIGFPAASETEFAFNRRLIEEGRIPDDVTVQVLVQAREELIQRTFESLIGAKSAIIHLYNSTSPAQRRVVFRKSKMETIDLAVRGAQLIKERLSLLDGTDVRLEYSPESFSATEVEFSKEVAEAVIEVWQPTLEKRMILNLPETVEVAGPHAYADQVEWMCNNLRNRDSVIISLHTHNDRGTGVAATELGLLAGGERVEGTLFGNGERTGNLDIVTMALNLYMHGIDPGLDFSDINSLINIYQSTTGMTVPPRQPYAGELVFTAFSGSHQDAIKKGLAEWDEGGRNHWDVPYLAIDPVDLGREYREVIRVNGQSGKAAVAYVLEKEFGLDLPRGLQLDFGPIANNVIDRLGREVTPREIRTMLLDEYVSRREPYQLVSFHSGNPYEGHTTCIAHILDKKQDCRIEGAGNGAVKAFCDALAKAGAAQVEVKEYKEQTLNGSSEAEAISYVRVEFPDGRTFWGIGVDTNSALAPIKAILSAINRSIHVQVKPHS